MLVCNVSLRPQRRAIAAELEEAAEADDTSTTGQLILATLVDDPGSANAFVDAYLGEIMVEAASATDTVNAGLVYATAIVEALTASATADGAVPTIYVGTVAEAASASSSQDATTTAATPYARTLSASRAGLGSVVAVDSSKTQNISNVGMVT